MSSPCWLGTHAIAQERGGTLLGEMVHAWLHGTGLGELGEFDARVRAVTTRDLHDLARTFFDEERRVEGIVRGTSG